MKLMKTEGDVKKGGNDTRTRNKLTFLQWSMKYILCFVSQCLIHSTIAEVTTCQSVSVSRTISDVLREAIVPHTIMDPVLIQAKL